MANEKRLVEYRRAMLEVMRCVSRPYVSPEMGEAAVHILYLLEKARLPMPNASEPEEGILNFSWPHLPRYRMQLHPGYHPQCLSPTKVKDRSIVVVFPSQDIDKKDWTPTVQHEDTGETATMDYKHGLYDRRVPRGEGSRDVLKLYLVDLNAPNLPGIRTITTFLVAAKSFSKARNVVYRMCVGEPGEPTGKWAEAKCTEVGMANEQYTIPCVVGPHSGGYCVPRAGLDGTGTPW